MRDAAAGGARLTDSSHAPHLRSTFRGHCVRMLIDRVLRAARQAEKIAMRGGIRGEPFIFDLLRRNLPAEEQRNGAPPPVSDRLAWRIMALAGSAALIWRVVSGALSS